MDTEHKHNLEALAKRAGVTATYLRCIRRKARRPSSDLAGQLEALTGVDRRLWLWPSQYGDPFARPWKGEAKTICTQS